VNEKSKVGTAATLAAAAALVALACTCSTCGLSDFSLPSLGGGGSDEIAVYEELLKHEYEDPFDPDLLVMADDDGDGLPEATYPLTVEEEVAPGVYLDRWLYLDPNGEDIDGTLQLVLENTTDDPVDVTFVDEIPKSVRERIEPGDIQVEPPVEITILDEDPRYELRVLAFAARKRQKIAEARVDAGGLLTSLWLLTATQEEVDKKVAEQIESHTMDFLVQTAHFTSREWDFLRRAAECAAMSEPARGEAYDPKAPAPETVFCNWGLLADFPDKFTTEVCTEQSILGWPQYQALAGDKTRQNKLGAKLMSACVQMIEGDPQGCQKVEGSSEQAACLEMNRRASVKECDLLPTSEQEGCKEDANRDHAQHCSETVANRASRNACCEELSGDLKKECRQDNTGDEAAEELGKTLTLEELLGSTDPDKDGRKVCEALSSLELDYGYARLPEGEDAGEGLVLSCDYVKDDEHAVELMISHWPAEAIQLKWDKRNGACERGYQMFWAHYDVTRCGQDALFVSDPDWSPEDNRTNWLYARPDANTFIEVREDEPPGPELTSIMQDLMEVAVLWSTGGTLTLDEVLGTE